MGDEAASLFFFGCRRTVSRLKVRWRHYHAPLQRRGGVGEPRRDVLFQVQCKARALGLGATRARGFFLRKI